MSIGTVGVGAIAQQVAARDGLRSAFTVPSVFAVDSGTRGPEYWRAVGAYYCAVEALCGGRRWRNDGVAVESFGEVDDVVGDGGDVGAHRAGSGVGGGFGDGDAAGGAYEACCGNEGSGHGGDAGDVAFESAASVKVRGKHWAANQRKRAKQKAMKRSWRSVDVSGGCVSDESVVSVRTVDTRTAVEIEAAQTLAARRVVENQLAIAKGQAQLRGFRDSAKTDAVNRLAAARMEQRINEAKAKSQASYKKCDESSRSLGSTGSAGEFAMRVEIQKAKESERMLKYVQEQADYLAKHASPEVLQHVRDMPSPEPVDAYEIFGDCSSDLSPHEAAAYYDELNRLNEESMLRFGRY